MLVHPLVARLARAHTLPRKEVAACRAAGDEIRPVFIDVLRRASDRDALAPDEDITLVFIVHLLGEFADPAAFEPLVTFLRSEPERVDEALGDTVTEMLNGIIISVFDGDRRLLEGLIEDAGVDQFVRAAALEAWTWLVAAGRIEREYAERFLTACASTRLLPEDDVVWRAWMISVAYLGAAGLRERAKEVYEDRVDPLEMSYAAFERLWADARASADVLDLLDREGWCPFEDALAEFQKWHCYSGAYRRKRRREAIAIGQADNLRNPDRHVGRNDPCPCGSGKKFKRCCGA